MYPEFLDNRTFCDQYGGNVDAVNDYMNSNDVKTATIQAAKNAGGWPKSLDDATITLSFTATMKKDQQLEEYDGTSNSSF